MPGYNSLVRRGLLPLICFLFFVLLYGLTTHADATASDEIAAFRTGVVLALHHNLIIDDIKSVQKITPIGAYGRGDHLYAKYFPGTAFSTAILYSLGARQNDVPYFAPNPTYNHVQLADSQTGAHIALAVNALLGALGLTMLVLLLDSLVGAPAAIITALFVGLTTDWWYESQLFYLEIGAGAFIIAGLYFAYKGRPWLAGLAIAGSLLVRPTSIVALPIWLYACRGKRPLDYLSAISILGSGVILALYNYVRFGSFFNFGYGSEGFTTPLLTGLAGLLFSPGHSFLLYSPIVLIGILGIPLLWRKDRHLALVSFIAIGGYILLSALWHSWAGGKVWGSRLVVPIIPVAGVLIAMVVQQAALTRKPLLVSAILILGLLGLGIQLLAIVQDPAISIRNLTQSGYATVDESTWSLAKSWLALELKSLATWSPCNIGSYVLRMFFTQCR